MPRTRAMTMMDKPYTVMVKGTFIDICDDDADEVSPARARSYSPPRARANSEPMYFKGCHSDDECVESLSTNGSDTCETNSTPDRKLTSSASDSGCAGSESDGHAQDLVDDDITNSHVQSQEEPVVVQPLWAPGAHAMNANAQPWQYVMSQPRDYAAKEGNAYDPATQYWMVPMPMADGTWQWVYQQRGLEPEPSKGDELEAKAAELELAAAHYAAAAREAAAAAKHARAESGTLLRPQAIEKVEAPKKVTKQKLNKTQKSAKDVGTIITADERTTIMLRNLPNDYHRDMVMNLLDSSGFVGRYDFLYLPIDFHRWAGFGYAFINMVSNADAERVRVHFDGFSEWCVASQKVCEVCWGEPIQGFDKHVDRYRNSPVMHELVPDEFKPVVFMNGQRAPFPAPTKRIRPPRTKTRPPCSGSVKQGFHLVADTARIAEAQDF